MRNGKPLSPSDEVQPTDTFCFLEEGIQYVSRGGYKLVRGLDVFGESVDGMVFADLGASTGGFTEVLLRRKASMSMRWMSERRSLLRRWPPTRA